MTKWLAFKLSHSMDVCYRCGEPIHIGEWRTYTYR
jgi:hypothetical protein